MLRARFPTGPPGRLGQVCFAQHLRVPAHTGDCSRHAPHRADAAPRLAAAALLRLRGCGLRVFWTSPPRTCAGCFLNDFPATTWDDVRLQSVASVGQLAVPVRVRHERDPYLYFLDISDGRGDFGLKTSEKVRRCTAAPGVPCLSTGLHPWPTALCGGATAGVWQFH